MWSKNPTYSVIIFTSINVLYSHKTCVQDNYVSLVCHVNGVSILWQWDQGKNSPDQVICKLMKLNM